MILGILSDTHGQRPRARRAIETLTQLGATKFAHCGDVGGTDVLEELARLDVHIICGNTDCPDTPKVEYAASLGLKIGQPPPVRFEYGGRHFALFHGHEDGFHELLDHVEQTGALPDGFGPCDYVLHGHTHVASDGRFGPLRVINPGALYRAVVFTVATLDVENDELKHWLITDEAVDTPIRADSQFTRSGVRR